MMSYFQAILLGVVQGLTEFLPISSSGHLVFIESFFKGFRPPGIAYELLLHGATLLAILIFYRKRVLNTVKGVFIKESNGARRVVILLIVGTLPAALVGFFFEPVVTELFNSLRVVATMWLLTAVLLFIGSAVRYKQRGIEQLGLRDALIIGCAQALALLPGVSRSGATISVALMLRIRGSAAAEFSFLLAIPAILGALLLEARDIGGIMEAPYICGALAALLSGLLAIYLLLHTLKKERLVYFALYCLVLGIGTLIFL